MIFKQSDFDKIDFIEINQQFRKFIAILFSRANFTRLTLLCNLDPQICGYPIVRCRTRFRINRLPYRLSVIETRLKMDLWNCRFGDVYYFGIYLAPNQPWCCFPMVLISKLSTTYLQYFIAGVCPEVAGSITFGHFVSLLRNATSWPESSFEKGASLMTRQWLSIHSMK